MNHELRMENVAREIFSQVRTSIVMKMRFLDMAVFRLKPFPTKLSFATDGDYLYYYPVWLLKRYREESNSVIRDYMHVLLHCIFRHPFINSLVDHDLWNLACDIAAEAIILEFRQPLFSVKTEVRRGAVISELKTNVPQMTAEKLYHYFQNNPPDLGWKELFHADDHEIWYDQHQQQSLQQQAQKELNHEKRQEKSSDTDSSENEDSQDSNSQSSSGSSDSDELQQQSSIQSAISEEWKDISEHVQMDLETFAKEQGYQAGNMEQLLVAVNREKFNYEAFLKKFAVMGEVMKINDDEFDYVFYTYGLKLFKNMPLIEPLEYKEVKRIRDFVIAIDTSGSTSGELVQKFLTKTYNILESTESFFTKVNIFIMQCDADIQEVVRVTKKEEFEEYIQQMIIKGLGGTDFRPVFEYVNHLIREKVFTNLKGLIYFTDGYGTFPTQKPDYQAAFVFIQDEYNNMDVPSWAIKLILEKEEI